MGHPVYVFCDLDKNTKLRKIIAVKIKTLPASVCWIEVLYDADI